MTDTGSSYVNTGGDISSHGESHTSMSRGKSRGMSRVDPTETSPQVRKSRASDSKSRAPLPREVTFSALSLGRAERDSERGIDQQNTPSEPEPVGPLAEQFLDQLAAQQADDDLTARRRAALARLGRAHTTSPLLATRRQEPS